MNWKKGMPAICGAVIISLSAVSQSALHALNIKNEEQLQEYFRYTGKDIPLISGHRGCHVPDYPENSIEVFTYVLQHAPAFFEIDPRLTKDNVVVLVHDATLDRTTTGTGKLAEYTWEEVKKLKLKDKNGKVTPYRIPTLAEAIEWARGKTEVIFLYSFELIFPLNLLRPFISGNLQRNVRQRLMGLKTCIEGGGQHHDC